MVKIEPNAIKQSVVIFKSFVLHKCSLTPLRAKVKVPGVLRNPPVCQSDGLCGRTGADGNVSP